MLVYFLNRTPYISFCILNILNEIEKYKDIKVPKILSDVNALF